MTSETTHLRRDIGRATHFLTTLTESLTVRVLGSRGGSPSQRRAIQRRIASDPNVDRAMNEMLAERPQFRRKDVAEAAVQDQST